MRTLTRIPCLAAGVFAVALAAGLRAQVPGRLNYQGRVVLDGTNVEGVVRFKFAIASSNAAHAAVAAATVYNGFVVAVTVLDGGLGYTAVPAVQVIDATGAGASATARVEGGAVVGIDVTAAGFGYSAAPAVLVEPPPPGAVFVTRWTNDGSPGPEPAAAVAVSAARGLFAVELGDDALPHMTPVPASVFDCGELWLRSWFSRDGAVFEELLPAHRLNAAGQALRAAGVVPGGVTSAMLAEGAVTAPALAPGCVGAAAVDAGQVQRRVSGSAPEGYALRAIQPDGSVVVTPVPAGDITGVSAGAGLVGGGAFGEVALAVGIGAIAGAHLLDGGVGSNDLAAAAVTTEKLAAGAVTLAKLDAAALDSRYVNAVGDTVGGPLTVNGACSVAGGLTVDSMVLVVDAVNNRVGVNKAAPGEALDVGGGRIGGVGTPNSDDDAVSKAYLDSRLGGQTRVAVSPLKMVTNASQLTISRFSDTAYVSSSAIGSYYVYIPMDLPVQQNGVPMRVRSLKIAYRALNATSYIDSLYLTQMQDEGGLSHLLVDMSDRTSTVWTTDTLTANAFVSGSTVLSLYLRYNGTGAAHQIYVGNIVVTLEP